VVGLERLSHGFARLRILKDRDGDLAVGDEWPLLFTRGEGFRLDPKPENSQEELEQRILELGSDGTWRTYKDFAAELGVRQKRTKEMLEALAESEHVEVAIGPAGRSPKARCYRTEPERWAQSGYVTPSTPESGHGLTEPDVYKGDVGSGSVHGWPKDSGAVGSIVPIPPPADEETVDEDEVEYWAKAAREGQA
jgi:hypothetical protein